MELPHLGKHCSEATCNLLDFLHIKCDACEQIFCKDHYTYSGHNCQAFSFKKNIQVPMCPLCNAPVPVNRNELPDIRVSEHIDRDCRSNPQKKVFVNKCASTGCKKRELMPLKCEGCQQNYCLKHRHPHDHNCQPSTRSTSSSFAARQPGAAAMSRANKNQNVSNKNFQKNTKTSIQPSMSEDEALARALQMSMLESPSQESEDQLLARALAESEQDYRKQRHKSDSSCCVA